MNPTNKAAHDSDYARERAEQRLSELAQDMESVGSRPARPQSDYAHNHLDRTIRQILDGIYRHLHELENQIAGTKLKGDDVREAGRDISLQEFLSPEYMGVFQGDSGQIHKTINKIQAMLFGR